MPFRVQRKFPLTTQCRCLPKGNCCQRQNAAARPRGIAANGRRPPLVQAELLLTARCRCLSRGNCCQRQSAVPCPKEISANDKMPLLAQAELLLTAKRCCLPKRNYCQRQNAAARPSGIAANDATPLHVQTEFLQTTTCRFSFKWNTYKRRTVSVTLCPCTLSALYVHATTVISQGSGASQNFTVSVASAYTFGGSDDSCKYLVVGVRTGLLHSYAFKAGETDQCAGSGRGARSLRVSVRVGKG